MVLRNGNYYLVCYDEDKEDMALFRVEKIKNAVPLKEPAKDYRTVSALARWNFNLAAYLDDCVSLMKCFPDNVKDE